MMNRNNTDKHIVTSATKSMRFTNSWKSRRILYFLGILAMMILYSGIPWVRTVSISVPSQSGSNVTVGIFTAKRMAGHRGLPITVTQEQGATLIFSCAEPGLKLGNATCFRNQDLHNGTLVKIYWSEQPSGYILDSANRPSRIEKLDGTVIFSEEAAVQLLDSQVRLYRNAVIWLFLLSLIVYFPLMLVLDRLAVIEKQQHQN